MKVDVIIVGVGGDNSKRQGVAKVDNARVKRGSA